MGMDGAVANFRNSRLCFHPFHPLTTPCGGLERIGKVLCFPRHLVAAELHDAHGVGWLAVICKDEFGDPKITAAYDSPHRKALLARLTGTLALYVRSAASALVRLWILQHRVLAIDVVLRFKIVGIGCRPMLIQCRAYLFISCVRILLFLLWIVHFEFLCPPIFFQSSVRRSRLLATESSKAAITLSICSPVTSIGDLPSIASRTLE